MQFVTQIARRTILLAAASAALASSGVQAADSAPVADSAAASRPATALGLILASTGQGDFRVADLLPCLEANSPPRRAPADPSELVRQPPEVLAAQARKCLAEREIDRAFRQTSPRLPADLQQAIQDNRSDEARDRLFLNLTGEMPEITTATARAYYENNRVEFLTPVSFSMRHLSLLAYEPHVVQPGETLESIAEKISGAPSAIEGILTDAVGKLQRWVPPNQRDRRAFRPLQAGERLLVPMSPKARQEVRRTLERDILSQLKAGKDFAWLCQTYSEAEDKGKVIGPLPFGTAPMLPEIIEAAKSVPVGTVSGIIETRHGFEVIQITERADERQVPFDEVARQIQDNLRKKRLREFLDERVRAVWSSLRIDYNVLLDPLASSSTVAAKTAARVWTKGQLESRPIGKDLQEATIPTQVSDALQKDPEISRQAFLEYAEQQGHFKDPAFAERLAIQSRRIVADWVIAKAQDAAAARLTEPELRSWYERNIALFTPPRRYAVRQIAINLDPTADLNDPEQRLRAEQQALTALRKAVGGVKTAEDFAAAARKASQDQLTARNGGALGEIVAPDRLGKFADVLTALPVQTPSEPFIYGRMAFVIWVDNVVAPPPPSFDKARPAVVQRAQTEARDRAKRQQIEEALARIGYRSGFEKGAV